MGCKAKRDAGNDMTELRIWRLKRLTRRSAPLPPPAARPAFWRGAPTLLVQMRAGSVKPGLIVDIKKIAEMTSIEETSSGFRIGAAVSGMALHDHPRFGKVWPGVLEAVNLIGSKNRSGAEVSPAAIFVTARRPATACPRWSRPVPSSPCRARTAAVKSRWSRCRKAPAAPLSIARACGAITLR